MAIDKEGNFFLSDPATREEQITQITSKDKNINSKMSDDGTAHKPLVYPISDTNRYGAKVTFVPQLITGPKLDGDASFGDALTAFTKGVVSAVTPQDLGSKEKEDTGPGFFGGLVAGFNGDDPDDSGTKETDPNAVTEENKPLTISKGVNMPITTKKISVYLPIAFGSTDTLTYDSPSIGSAGAILSNALDNANGGGAGDVLGNALGDFINLFKGASQAGANSLGKLGIAKLAKRGPTEVGDGAAAALRVTVDPNIRTLFRSVAVRQFAFSFKFIAKNSKEAAEIRAIIKRFRFYAYPESIGFGGAAEELEEDNENFPSKEEEQTGSAISVGFKYPHPFLIKTEFVDENKNVFDIGPKIKSCYLTSITTNFNPSSMAFHRDGEPVEIDLSLNFTEETTLNKKDILQGY